MATTAKVTVGDFVTHHDQGGVYEVYGHGEVEPGEFEAMRELKASARVDVYLMAAGGTPRKVRGRVNADGSLTLSGCWACTTGAESSDVG